MVWLGQAQFGISKSRGNGSDPSGRSTASTTSSPPCDHPQPQPHYYIYQRLSTLTLRLPTSLKMLLLDKQNPGSSGAMVPISLSESDKF